MKEQVCCFTGHRDMRMPVGEVRRRLSDILDYLISRGVIYYGCGGALGFDTQAALEVIEKRKRNPRVKLILVLPCKDQDKKWRAEDQATYSFLKTQADKTVYISETYTSTCMHERNRHLVNESRYCIAFLQKQSGGTAYTFNYAREKGLVIYNLADNSYMEHIQFDTHP